MPRSPRSKPDSAWKLQSDTNPYPHRGGLKQHQQGGGKPFVVRRLTEIFFEPVELETNYPQDHAHPTQQQQHHHQAGATGGSGRQPAEESGEDSSSVAVGPNITVNVLRSELDKEGNVHLLPILPNHAPLHPVPVAPVPVIPPAVLPATAATPITTTTAAVDDKNPTIKPECMANYIDQCVKQAGGLIKVLGSSSPTMGGVNGGGVLATPNLFTRTWSASHTSRTPSFHYAPFTPRNERPILAMAPPGPAGTTPKAPNSPPVLVRSKPERPKVCKRRGRPPAEDAPDRPSLSYSSLILEALLSVQTHTLSFREICLAITAKHPFYQNKSRRWKNSIRNNLVSLPCFHRSGGLPAPDPNEEALASAPRGKRREIYKQLREEEQWTLDRNRNTWPQSQELHGLVNNFRDIPGLNTLAIDTLFPPVMSPHEQHLQQQQQQQLAFSINGNPIIDTKLLSYPYLFISPSEHTLPLPESMANGLRGAARGTRSAFEQQPRPGPGTKQSSQEELARGERAFGLNDDFL